MNNQFLARAADTATISGRVSNQATGAYLPGATVYIEGTPHSAVADEEGSYQLQVPPGRHDVSVRYTGLNPQVRTVDVMPGGESDAEL